MKVLANSRGPATRAVVTMAIGRLDYTAFTLPLMQRWAEREGCDFIVLDERKVCFNPNWPKRRFGIHLEKFQLRSLFERYERLLYLDADILVNPRAPSPFDLVPEESVGGVWDDSGVGAWKREEELVRLARHHRAPLPTRLGPRYLNAGMLVLSRAHEGLWRFDRRAFCRGRWPEQSLFNYRRIVSGTPVQALPREFNFLPLHRAHWGNDAIRRGAHFLHFAGQPAKQRLAKDFLAFEAAWSEEIPVPFYVEA
ncbi:MAG: hypothetical protein ACOC3I_04625 [Verrucomicrobiota bacterium]